MMYLALEGRRPFARRLPPPLQGWMEDAPSRGSHPWLCTAAPPGLLPIPRQNRAG